MLATLFSAADAEGVGGVGLVVADVEMLSGLRQTGGLDGGWTTLGLLSPDDTPTLLRPETTAGLDLGGGRGRGGMGLCTGTRSETLPSAFSFPDVSMSDVSLDNGAVDRSDSNLLLTKLGVKPDKVDVEVCSASLV